MKKINRFIITAVIMLAAFCAFGTEKKSVVCVSFPEYDWVCNILGERSSEWNVTLLQSKGTDPHSWQPSFADIAKISECDIFVYNGGESDKWAGKALQNVTNKSQIAVNLMDSLGDRAKAEEIVEGMQAEEGHHHHDGDEDEHDGHHDDDDDECEIEYDEHIWLSLRNAVVLVGALTDAVAAADSANEPAYRDNAAAYIQQLDDLDKQYQAAVDAASCKTVLFGDRFPFRYMTDDYGLQYYAAFAGCSAESEASFETVIFLARKIDELGLRTILTIEKSNKKIAKTIAANTKIKKIKIMELDSLQSVNMKEIKKGKSYLSVMIGNLEVLKKVLNNA